MTTTHAWTFVKVWHEEDDYTEYKIKVEYSYESGHTADGVYWEGHKSIHVLEYPPNATNLLKLAIDNQLPYLLDQLIEEDYETDEDFEPLGND